MAKEKKEHWPKHLVGPRYGYHLYEDGSVKISDSHADTMKLANDKRAGVNMLIDAVNKYVTGEFAHVNAMEQAFWQTAKEEYGLDFDNYDYSYNAYEKRISRKPRPAPKEQSPRPE